MPENKEPEDNKLQLKSNGDPWFIRAVRPTVTVVVLCALVAVLIHGTIWAGDRNAFEAMVTIGGMILAYWFGGREAKSNIRGN